MDFIGILKEAWQVTWRHRALWILGLFVGGGASISTVNWQMDTSDFQGQTFDTRDFQDLDQLPVEMRQVVDEIREFFQSGSVPDWLPWLLVGIAVLILLGFVLWVLSIAARGGIIDQSNEALAGREVSATAGWRAGFRRWGRVFLVGLLLALPQLVIGILFGLLTLGMVFFFIQMPGEPFAGLLGLAAFVPVAIIMFLVVGVVVGILREMAFRRAVLSDLGAGEAIKTTWHDLKARRGLATMWLIMLVVGIGAGVATGIIMVPLVVVVGLLVGAFVVGAGTGGLWALLPLGLIVFAVGMLLKAVYAAFRNTAWTSFFVRMTETADAD